MPRTTQPTKRRQHESRKTFAHLIYFDSHIEPKVNQFLANNTTERAALTRSALVRKALSRFFNDEENYWSLAFTRFNSLSTKVSTLTRRVELLINILLHFLGYYFLTWPDFAPEEKEEATLKADGMLMKFEDSLKIKLEAGGYLNQLMIDDIKNIAVEALQELKDDTAAAKKSHMARHRAGE